MELTDRELLIRFAVARDEQAFVALVRRYERLVRAACRRVLRDVHLADDAFQAVFLVLAARAKTLCHRHESLAPWLYTVASNAALQLRRSRKRAERREQQGRPASETSALAELLGMLDEELQRLDGEARDAIVLCHLQGLTQDAAAAVLGVSKSTLRRQIDRGMETLRGRFRRRGLLVPMLAVLWNAVAEQEASAADPTAWEPLAELARQWVGPMPRGQHDGRLSETSWNLTRRVLTMSRWNQVRWWSGWGLTACVVLGIGLLPVIAQSEAAEKVEKPAKVGRKPLRTPQGGAVAANESPGVVPETAPVAAAPPKDEAVLAEPTVTTLAAAKKPKPSAEKKRNPRDGNGTQPSNASAATQTQGGNSRSFTAGASGGMTGGTSATNVNGVFSGTVTINGKEVKTNDPAEFERLLQTQRASFPQFPGLPDLPNLGKGFPNRGGNGAASGGFSGGSAGGSAGGGGATSTNGANGFQGKLNINGKEQTFTDKAEFDKALKDANFPMPMGK